MDFPWYFAGLYTKQDLCNSWNEGYARQGFGGTIRCRNKNSESKGKA